MVEADNGEEEQKRWSASRTAEVAAAGQLLPNRAPAAERVGYRLAGFAVAWAMSSGR